MLISLDGGQTYQPAPEGVRIMLDAREMTDNGEDFSGVLAFNFTDEGVIYDIWKSVSHVLSESVATQSQTYEELIDKLLETW